MLTTILCTMLLIPVVSPAQRMDSSAAAAFAHMLIWQPDSMNHWFNDKTLVTAHRLDIEYDGVSCKNLISYNISDSLRTFMQKNDLTFAIRVDTLEEGLDRLTLSLRSTSVMYQYLFRNRRCVSPFEYYTRHWIRIASDHFSFFLSDSEYFNPYCVRALEDFVLSTGKLLELSDEEMKLLQDSKILYVFCKDETEIEQLTGYRARGMYNLAYDAVITTYPAHLHELSHLLINYKLHRLPLYTHPFLQEGFATALGGRGGMGRNVLRSIGNSLVRSQFVDLPSLISRPGFESMDASLSYPASGLYVTFLIESLGLNPFLDLYRRHSGGAADSAVLHIPRSELQPDWKWNSFLDSTALEQLVVPATTPANAQPLWSNRDARISEDSLYYYFSLSLPLLLPPGASTSRHKSRVFLEFFPTRVYGGEKYLLWGTEEGVSIYNLLTGDIIASYGMSFSDPPTMIPKIDNKLSFGVRKAVFAEPLREFLRGSR
jgi:hypothetical protein